MDAPDGSSACGNFALPGFASGVLHSLWDVDVHLETAERKFPAVFFYAHFVNTEARRPGGFLYGFDQYFRS